MNKAIDLLSTWPAHNVVEGLLFRLVVAVCLLERFPSLQSRGGDSHGVASRIQGGCW